MQTPASLCDSIRRCLEDALRRHTAHAIQAGIHFANPAGILLDECAVHTWPQVWGDTTCGFGGVGGQMITTEQTVVCYCITTDSAAVYHAGRLAYFVFRPSDAFWQAFYDRRLAGAAEVSPRYAKKPDGRLFTAPNAPGEKGFRCGS